MIILNCVISVIGDLNLQDWEFTSEGYLQEAQWGLEFITNLLVTILIAYKAWFVKISTKKLD